ncbi:MAG: hypothetical protein IKW13_01055, partial [Thermoguttaceae bacterium]|nr:hypothetical protein [Thermoguttaceae bacterium]
MQKNTSNNRRFALSAKFFFAALCVVFGWFVSSSLSSGSALGETWRFRFDSFDLFSTVARNADETPVCYLDASGRRVGDVVLAASNVDAAPAFFADETELLANDVLVGETEAVGATFDETAPELEPVSFAAAEENAPRFENAGWVVVDADAQDRDK